MGETFFIFQNLDQTVSVVGSARMHWKRRRLIHNINLIIFKKFNNRKIVNWKLSSNSVMLNSVTVLDYVGFVYRLAIYRDVAFL